MLYIVSTPIGNLADISFRAVEVLKSVDVIAAEDTRHTALLLSRYGITTHMIAYHKFNEKSSVGGIIQMLKEGKDVAVVSDAGTPTVSDPGHVLIDEAVKNGVQFTAIPGACAGIDALVLSGLDTRAFTLVGFLPEKNADRRKFIQSYAALPCTLIVYSAVHDIKKDLAFLFEELGARKFALCRELTKMYETVTRGTLGEQVEIVEKGEFVIVIEGVKSRDFSALSIEEHILQYVGGGMELREAIKTVASERHIAKSEVYRIAQTLKDSGAVG